MPITKPEKKPETALKPEDEACIYITKTQYPEAPSHIYEHHHILIL